MLGALALLTLLVWLGLVFAWHGFWRADVGLPAGGRAPEPWPSVTVLVPARNEHETIGSALASLLAQDYPGPLRVVVANDASEDATAAVARRQGDGNQRLHVVDARPKPPGWAGKLWALDEAMAAGGEPEWYWLTDADIVHEPAALRRVADRCLAGIRALLAEAEPLPGGLRSRRLGMESAVIVRIARRLTDELARRDPLAERVELSRPQLILCGLGGMLARLGR